MQHFHTTGYGSTSLRVNGTDTRSAYASTVLADGTVWYLDSGGLWEWTTSSETQMLTNFTGHATSMAVSPAGDVYIGDDTGHLWVGTP